MVSTTNLQAYYKCDENAANTTVDDAHTTSNDGISSTNTSNLYDATGSINSCFDMTASSSECINIDIVDADIGTSTTGSWNFWVKPDDGQPAAAQTFLSFGDTNAVTWIRISLETDGKVSASVMLSGTFRWRVITDAAVFSNGAASGFTMISLIQDGIEPEIYINGSKPAQTFTVSTDKTAWFNDVSGIDNGRIACRNKASEGDTAFYDGRIDEIGIWDTNISSSDITDLYNSGNGFAYPFAINVTIEPTTLTLSTTNQEPLYTIKVQSLNLSSNLNLNSFFISREQTRGDDFTARGTTGTATIRRDVYYTNGVATTTDPYRNSKNL